MTSHWILQANPDHIRHRSRRSLLVRDRMANAAVRSFDCSGRHRRRSGAAEAKPAFGVGRVLDYPWLTARSRRRKIELHARSDGEGGAHHTSAVAVRPSTFVPKRLLQASAGGAEHQIITAPMGTVFQVSDAQWSTLAPHLPTAPDRPRRPPRFPPALGWEERRKTCIRCRRIRRTISTRLPTGCARRWRFRGRPGRHSPLGCRSSSDDRDVGPNEPRLPRWGRPASMNARAPSSSVPSPQRGSRQAAPRSDRFAALEGSDLSVSSCTRPWSLEATPRSLRSPTSTTPPVGRLEPRSAGDGVARIRRLPHRDRRWA